MITHVIAEPATQSTRGRSRSGYAEDFVNRAWVWTYRAYIRVKSRREMRRLPEEMLKDLGITQADAEREASKPFWR